MTSFWLKIIAVLTMILDHIGYMFFPYLDVELFGYVFPVLRVIGRISFPIYAFLIVEGVLHTSNWKKYAGRLFLLAVISEVPFDLAFFQGIDWSYQNVFFTLLLGMLAIQCDLYFRAKGNHFYGLFALIGACWISELSYLDYAVTGVLMIYWFYQTRGKKLWMFLGLAGINLYMGYIQAFAILAAVPILLYNGQVGWRHKWVQYGFYLVYPIHLIALYLIGWWITG